MTLQLLVITYLNESKIWSVFKDNATLDIQRQHKPSRPQDNFGFMNTNTTKRQNHMFHRNPSQAMMTGD